MLLTIVGELSNIDICRDPGYVCSFTDTNDPTITNGKFQSYKVAFNTDGFNAYGWLCILKLKLCWRCLTI